jgi:antibiotic biosynthesis monooxygenase (ABM) superfamily enzyme
MEAEDPHGAYHNVPRRATEEIRLTVQTAEQLMGKDDAHLVVRLKHTLKSKDYAEEYIQWAHRASKYVHEHYSGHLYSTVINHSHKNQMITIMRYNRYDHLITWLNSEERKKFIHELDPIISSVEVDVADGAANIFGVDDDEDEQLVAGSLDLQSGKTPQKPTQDRRPPPKWKQGVVGSIAVYAVVMLANYTLIPWLNNGLGLKPYPALVLFILIIVAVPPLQYVITPLFAKVMKFWLVMPRPIYPPHSLMFAADSGFQGFAISADDVKKEIENSLLQRVCDLEIYSESLNTRIRYLESGGKALKVRKDSLFEALKAEQDKIIDKVKQSLEESHRRETKDSTSEEKDLNQSHLPVSIILSHRVRWRFVKQYEEWITDTARIISEVSQGYLGSDIIRPSKIDLAEDGKTYVGVYSVTMRFDTHEHLLSWLQSDIRLQRLMQAQPYLQSDQKITVTQQIAHPAFDSFFVSSNINPFLPTSAPPPKYKTAILTVIGIYPVAYLDSIWVGSALSGAGVPSPVSTLITTIINTYVTAYIAAPILTRIFGAWVTQNPMSEIPVKQPWRCLHIGFRSLG